MKDKFFEWFDRNRKTIGYTVGVLNLLAAVSYLIQGQYGLAMLWLFVGSMIVYDSQRF
jgi:hypothetical protein